MGIPVPAVIINDRATDAWRRATGVNTLETGQGVYACVDGRQRIETAVAWWQGDLAVPASWFPAEEVAATEDTEDGPYVRYTGLTLSGQRHFTNRAMLPMVEAQVPTVADEAALYLLVNGGGTAQTEADMANAAAYASDK